MNWTLHLPFPKIPEGLSLNARSHWRVKNRSTREVRELVTMLARSQRIPKLERIGVSLTWVVADNRVRDPDNMAGLFKVAVDGLASNKGISARIVADDDPAHVHRDHPVIEHRPDDIPHFELVVVDISHPFRSSDVESVAERLTP